MTQQKNWTLGRGSSFNEKFKSINEKIGTGTKTEFLTGSNGAPPQVLWIDHFGKAQGWTMNTKENQDNKRAMPLDSI